MRPILILLAALLTGCANMGDYYASIDGANARQVEAMRAASEADAIRYQALMRIAESGDATAKVAAAMALALGGQSRSMPQMAIPQQPPNEALQWASVVVPALGQGLQTWANLRLGLRQSDNALARDGLMWGTVGGMAGHIAKDPLVVEQPAPVIVTQPPPLVIEQPEPVVVEPIIVEPSYPPAQAM